MGIQSPETCGVNYRNQRSREGSTMKSEKETVLIGLGLEGAQEAEEMAVDRAVGTLSIVGESNPYSNTRIYGFSNPILLSFS